MADIATLQARHDAACTALHNLLIGQQAVTVDAGDGISVTYTKAEESKLRNYIAELALQLGLPTAPKRRAIGLVF